MPTADALRVRSAVGRRTSRTALSVAPGGFEASAPGMDMRGDCR